MTQLQDNTHDEDDVLDYDALSQEFERGLLETLRSHGIGQEFLEYWVPDADPAKGLVSMIESAGMAGRDHLRIRISKSLLRGDGETATAGQLDVADGTSVTVHDEGERFLFSVSGIIDPARVATGSVKPAANQSDQRDGTDSPSIAGQEKTAETETLRAQFESIATEILSNPVYERHETSIDDPIVPETAVLSFEVTSEVGAGLHARIQASDGTIISLTHSQGSSSLERAALETLCRIATGKPLTEAADHSGLHVIDHFIEVARERMGDAAALIPGIVLPSNQPPAMSSGITMIREIRELFEATTGKGRPESKYTPHPSDAWLSMSADDRLSILARSKDEFLRGTNHAQDAISILRVESNRTTHPVRVAIELSETSLSFEEKPGLIRTLEKWLRRDVEPTLELIADRVVDESPLRRLGGSSTPNDKSMASKQASHDPTEKDPSS